LKILPGAVAIGHPPEPIKVSGTKAAQSGYRSQFRKSLVLVINSIEAAVNGGAGHRIPADADPEMRKARANRRPSAS
jgi:hypothetical protein